MTSIKQITTKHIQQIEQEIQKFEKLKEFSQLTLAKEIFIINQQPQIIDAVFVPQSEFISQKGIQNLRNSINISPKQLKITNKGVLTSKDDENIDIANYSSIYIQSIITFNDFQAKINNEIRALDKQIKNLQPGTFKRIFNSKQDNKQIDEKIQQFKRQKNNLIKDAELFLTPWNNLDYKYRVACYGSNRRKYQKHFWVYFKESKQAIETKDKLLYLSLNKNNDYLYGRMRDLYNQQMKAILFNGIIKNLKVEQQPRQVYVPTPPQSKILQPPSKKLFQKYEEQLKHNLILDWKNQLEKLRKITKKKLFIEIKEIKIDKKLTPKDVELEITNFEAFKKINLLKYDRADSNHFIFTLKKKQVYTLEYQNFYRKKIAFIITTIQNNGEKKIFKNYQNFQQHDQLGLGFSYSLGLIPQKKQDMNTNFIGSFPNTINFEVVLRQISFNIQDVIKNRKILLLSNLGKIPNSYGEYYQFQYTPNNYKLIHSIVQKDQMPLSKKTFVDTYLKLVNLLNHQQNKSKNFTIFQQYKKQLRSQQQCYRSQKRLEKYWEKLSIDKMKQKFNKDYMNLKNQNSIYVHSVNLANLNDQLNRFQSPHKQKIKKIMRNLLILINLDNKAHIDSNQKYSLTHQRLKKSQQCLLKFLPSMLPIASYMLNIVINSEKYFIKSSQFRKDSLQDDTVWLLFAFLKHCFVYSSTFNLKLQLYHIRALVQKYLPQFMRTLNRKGVGLENFAGKHLLQMFTEFNHQVTYRIWDLIVNSKNIFKLKIITVYTLMLFMETTELLPIFPINKFIRSISQNNYKIELEVNYVYHFDKHMTQFTQVRKRRQSIVQKYAQQKYLKRFILNNQSSDIPNETSNFTNNFHHLNKLQTKLLSVSQLNYPLPDPKYPGKSVTQIHFFIHYISIMQSFNFIDDKLLLEITYENHVKQRILETKNIFLNWHINFPFQKNASIKIKITSLSKKMQKILCNEIKIDKYSFDRIYKNHMILNYPDNFNFHNKGQSTLSFMICLKSIQSKMQVKQKYNIDYMLICDRLLDYDWSIDGNSSIKAMQQMYMRIESMKRPLDQFGKQQYTNLKIAGLDKSQQSWIKNSKVSIQQLKAIFNTIFYDEIDLKLQFTTFYKLFTQQQKYQEFDLGIFLLELIMIKQLSRQKRITLLYCLCTHYQNSFCGQILIQTLNSIIKQICFQHGFLNGCPFFNNYVGKIEQGYYYCHDRKVQSNRKQITSILQDWAYICNITYGYNGIILGSSEDLIILRTLFTTSTIKQIMKYQLCRFQIIFTYDNHKYLWSVTVYSRDFSIYKRGMKLINHYPSNQQIDYLDSTAEVMLNCENLIPLQTNTTLNYQKFSNIFKDHTVFNYLLCQSLNPNTYKIIKQVQLKDQNDKIINQQPKVQYNDYAIFRYQNCIQDWKQCYVYDVEDAQPNYIVCFKDNKNHYTIPDFQVFDMSEHDIL